MPLTCLIVDDSDDFLASAMRLFSLQGLEVVGVASSGDEAFRLGHRPDVALVDVKLGDEDGIELGRQMTSAAHVTLISIRSRDQFAELLVEQEQRQPDAKPPHAS